MKYFTKFFKKTLVNSKRLFDYTYNHSLRIAYDITLSYGLLLIIYRIAAWFKIVEYCD